MNSQLLGKKFRSFITTLVITTLWLSLIFLIPLTWNITLPVQFWIKQVGFVLVLIVAYFINANLLVPKFLFKNKIYLYVFYLVLSVLIILVLMQIVEISLNLPEHLHKAFHPGKPFDPSKRSFRFDIIGLLITLLVFGISTTIRLVRKWQEDEEVRKDLEKQKISSELSFLKAQINPHFFFNTLNNIYALTSTNVGTAREAIHKLSRMMRYVLYETQKEKTLLSQELAFLEDYIELMKLRLTEKAIVKIEKPASFQDELIAPMILLPFIENAFKHGISSKVESTIFISIKQENNQLLLEVKNRKFKNSGLKLDGSSGIGLTNTKRRLDLLYPNKHKLKVTDSDDEFGIKLEIELS